MTGPVDVAPRVSVGSRARVDLNLRSGKHTEKAEASDEPSYVGLAGSPRR